MAGGVAALLVGGAFLVPEFTRISYDIDRPADKGGTEIVSKQEEKNTEEKPDTR